jgi:hypothetical protein
MPFLRVGDLFATPHLFQQSFRIGRRGTHHSRIVKEEVCEPMMVASLQEFFRDLVQITQ